MKISEKSTKDFEAACEKLKISQELPNVSMIRPDLGLYLTAHYMLAVLKEAEKGGKQYDIANHSKEKWFPWHIADHGYIPGSSAGGFRSTFPFAPTALRASAPAFALIVKRSPIKMHRITQTSGRSLP